MEETKKRVVFVSLGFLAKSKTDYVKSEESLDLIEVLSRAFDANQVVEAKAIWKCVRADEDHSLRIDRYPNVSGASGKADLVDVLIFHPPNQRIYELGIRMH